MLVAQEEEMEAMRIQQRQALAINDADYIDDSFAGLLERRLGDQGKFIVDEDEEDLVEESIFDVDGLQEGKLSHSEKQGILENMMPEVSELVLDYNERNKELDELESLEECNDLQHTKKRMSNDVCINARAVVFIFDELVILLSTENRRQNV